MKKLDLQKTVFLLSGALLVFFYGIAVARYRLFPHSLLDYAEDALAQVVAEREMLLGTRPTSHLFRARYEGSGVTHREEGRVSPGLTLLSGFFGDGLELRLIRLDGSVVRRWPARFHDLFADTSHIQPDEQVPRSDWNTSILGALAFPDGSVLFNLEAGGLVKQDRCGGVEWTVPRMVHHSLHHAEDGGFWVPGLRYVARDSPFPALAPPYKEETFIKVSAAGQVLQEISLPRVIFDNGMAALLFAQGPEGIPVGSVDLTHLNDAEELHSSLADRFPAFSAGDLLVSLRNLNLVMVMDPRTGKVKWSQTGPWLDQHDPDFLPAGRISVFSNNNDGTPTGSILGGSTIIQMDPATRASTVVYGGRDGQRFYTQYRGQHQYLPNGNLLVVDSMSGRVFEIDEGGALVWQMINRYDDIDVASVNDAVRYPDGYFAVGDWTCPGDTAPEE